jgi:hypothetical protein
MLDYLSSWKAIGRSGWGQNHSLLNTSFFISEIKSSIKHKNLFWKGFYRRINPIIGTCSNKKGRALRFSVPFLKMKL